MATDVTNVNKQSHFKRERPRTYKEIKSAPFTDLVYFAKEASIYAKGLGRCALETLLCDALGISTTGSLNDDDKAPKAPRLSDTGLDIHEVKEFERFTPAFVQSLTGWTKSIQRIPEIDVGSVKKYLLKSNNPDFSKDILKKYKLSRAYQHLQAKNIHSVVYNEVNDSNVFCLVKALCNPSQSTDNGRVKWLYVVLDKINGEPYGAFCACTVGQGQACSHVGALLFLLAEIIASGDESLPEDVSVTETLCQWTKPKGAQVNPELAENVSVRDPDRKRPTVSTYVQDVAPELSAEKNYQRILQLRSDIMNCNSKSAMPPIVKIIDMDRFRPFELPKPVVLEKLPMECLDFDLPICHEIITSNHPLPIYKVAQKQFSSVNHKNYKEAENKFMSHISNLDVKNVEKVTQGQSTSTEWFEQRKGAITGTKVKQILSFFEHGRANPNNIVADILQYNSKELNTPAVKWGISQENKAIDAYMKQFKKKHLNVSCERPGLLVDSKHPFLRVSPDAIISCSCHGTRVLEVKCPYTCRNMDPFTAIMNGNLDYAMCMDEQIKIKKNSRGYFEQVQMQMALSGNKQADFLIWTKVNHIVIDISFEEKWWENTVIPSLVRFFRQYIVAEMLTERIKNEIQQSEEKTVDLDKSFDEHLQGEVVEIDSSSVSDNELSEEQAITTTVACSDDDDNSCVNDGDDWVLGCKEQCRNDRAPTYSRVKDNLISCDVNIVCLKNSWFHLYCEGFRRMPKYSNSSVKYICTKCRQHYPDSDKHDNGFLL